MTGSGNFADSARRSVVGYMDRFQELLGKIDVDAVARAAEVLRQARDAGATVYIAGNGGSAATATHFANDLGKATKMSGRRPIRVLSMSDNVSWLTALANDEGYDRAFVGQLENFAKQGDVLIVISASGNSQNLVEAVEHGAANGMTSIGILGFDGGVLHTKVDESLWLESRMGDYGPVETGHSLICDLLTTCLIEDRLPGDGAEG
jgi:D-sedoheptulose 7-phosphate isomerase